MKKITIVATKNNMVKQIICEGDLGYEKVMEWARNGAKRWGWTMDTMETDRGYTAVVNEWKAAHPMVW